MADDLYVDLPDASAGTDDGNEPLGEYLMLPNPDEGLSVEETEDGGAIFTFGEEEEFPAEEGGFYDNLAEVIQDNILNRIATDLMHKIEQDKTDRAEGDKLYEEGLQRTGLGKDAPGGADFEGASRVVHPMLTEACIDYGARIIKELWPISGPVRPKILGEVTKEKTERAERVTAFMNYQLTVQMKEALGETESMLSQVPLGGVQYLKLWYDHRLRRPAMQFVPRDKCYIPKNAGGWYGAQRRTVADMISAVTLQTRIDSGMYRDLKLSSAGSDPEPTAAESANDKIEGKSSSGMNIDGDREIYETMSYLEITPDMAGILAHEEVGSLYPYLITIDVTSKQVLSIYRDWEEGDETYEPIDHIFEFPFIPWRGAYAIGLPQIIGGLSGAATGALRALLDSAMIANAQGGFILKGSGTGAKSMQPRFGEYAQLDGGGMITDDIRKLVMQFNSKEPSAVLFSLLGFIVEAGKGAVRTSLDEMNVDGNPNVPVGTQLSRVEEGLVVFSAIHGRTHAAFDRLLSGLHRLNRLYLPDDPIRFAAQGKEVFASRADFEGPPDVMPVSDPTIYSDQQRMAQINAVQQRSMALPQVYNIRNVEKRFLKLMKIDNPDELLVPLAEPTEQNAVNENVAMSLGKPVAVFPDQDHVAHVLTHLGYATSPAFGSNPLIAPKFLGPCLQHIAEHIVMLYAKWASELVSVAAGRSPIDMMSPDPEVKTALDKLLAVASGKIIPYATKEFERIGPALQQCQAVLKQFQPPPPVDPAQVALQSAQAETARRAQNDKQQGALAAAKLQQQAQDDAQRNAIAAQRNQITQQNAETAAAARIRETEIEAETAERTALLNLSAGKSAPHYRDGSSIRQ